MRNTLVKITALVCTVLMIASLVTACTAGRNEKVKDSSDPAPAQKEKPTESVKPAEPVTLTYIAPDSGRINKEDNPVVEEFEKRLNIKLEITLVPQSEFTNKFNLLVASKSVPDISRIGGYGFYEYIPQGAFIDISKMVESSGANMKKHIPKEAWDKVTVDGKIYAVPGYNWPGKNSFYMRQDWLDNLGLKAPSNLDELAEVMRKFTYNDPNKSGKNDTYGISTSGSISDIPGSLQHIFGAFGFAPRSYYEKDGKAYNPLITPEYKKSLEYIRMLYVEDKVFDPDFFIIKTDQAQQNLVQGKIGSFTGWWSIPESVLMDQMKMKSVNPDAEWVIVNNIKGKNGENGFGASGMISAAACISSQSKNPDAAFKFLDYLVSDEGCDLAFLGIKDIHYTEKAGEFEKRTPEGQKAYEEKWLDVFSLTVTRTDRQMDIYKVGNPTYWPYIVAARDANLYYNLFEGITTPEEQRLLADLKKFELEWFIRFVTGKEPLSKFDEYVNQWKDKGGKEIFDAYVREYNKRYGKNLTPVY